MINYINTALLALILLFAVIAYRGIDEKIDRIDGIITRIEIMAPELRQDAEKLKSGIPDTAKKSAQEIMKVIRGEE